RTIFVRSLPATTTTESLLSHFSQSFPIKHAIAVTDSTTKQCKGYGFVTFADPEDAVRAIQDSNGRDFEGRKIKVEIAEPRHREGEHGEATTNGINRAGKPSSTKEQELGPNAKPPRLIIRNLPWNIQESDQLAKLFMSYGKVKSATLPKKKDGAMSGFGFVLLRGRKNAEKAMQSLNGKEVGGRTIAVDWAVDKDTWERQRETLQDNPGPKGEEPLDTKSIKDQKALDTQTRSQELQGLSSDDDDIDEHSFEDELGKDDESPTAGISTNSHEPDNSSTLFIRNLPFSCTDEDLYKHFSQFGALRYARVVLDPVTERSRGTGFVSFFEKSEAAACLKNAPQHQNPQISSTSSAEAQPAQSVLQNDLSDVSGTYTIDGRVLHVSRAVDKSEAQRLAAETEASRGRQQRDKRRLYLLSEGTISSKSSLYKRLAPSEVKMREASAKQRQKLIETNPTLHLSLTRLSVRNVPRSITSKDLKALAREAVVGFAKDVKGGTRQPLSKEEVERGGEEMREAERYRKAKGKGVVKQAKIVFEGREGSKVNESSGAGRSRGYGFIEYYTHRSALMGLRWLNGHSVAYQVNDTQSHKMSKEDVQDRKKRLIVEFAIENVQVVGRRKDRESKARERAKTAGQDGTTNGVHSEATDPAQVAKKRKRGLEQETQEVQTVGKDRAESSKAAKRQQIIARKRSARKQRK
ncbi:RNA-binding domain-containing protein, partial [Viridothelium virens]